MLKSYCTNSSLWLLKAQNYQNISPETLQDLLHSPWYVWPDNWLSCLFCTAITLCFGTITLMAEWKKSLCYKIILIWQGKTRNSRYTYLPRSPHKSCSVNITDSLNTKKILGKMATNRPYQIMMELILYEGFQPYGLALCALQQPPLRKLALL